MVLDDMKISVDEPYVSKFRFVAFDGEPNPQALEKLWVAYAKETNDG